MSADTWICRQCGEEIDPQFEACWNCQTPREGIDGSIESEQPPTEEPPTPETMLAEILQKQQEQQESLRDVQYKVGCLYVYMIAGIVITLLIFLLSFLQTL